MGRAQMNPRNLACTPFHSLVRETPRGRLTSTAPHRGSSSSSRNSNITLGIWGSRMSGFGEQLSRRAAGSCAGSPLCGCWGNKREIGQSYSRCKNPNLGRVSPRLPREGSLALFKSMVGGEGREHMRGLCTSIPANGPGTGKQAPHTDPHDAHPPAAHQGKLRHAPRAGGRQQSPTRSLGAKVTLPTAPPLAPQQRFLLQERKRKWLRCVTSGSPRALHAGSGRAGPPCWEWRAGGGRDLDAGGHLGSELAKPPRSLRGRPARA